MTRPVEAQRIAALDEMIDPHAEVARQLDPSAPEGSGAQAAAPASGELGDLLRSAYQQAVDEPVPDDLLDLLNRLK